MAFQKHLLLLGLLVIVLVTSCLNPVEPVFQLEAPFYLVEGRLLLGPGEGEIRIRESAFSDAVKRFVTVEGAAVRTLENEGAAIEWTEVAGEPGVYRVPENTVVRPGEIWRLDVVLPDGTTIVSDPQTVPEPVEVTGLDVVFEQNSVFDPGIRRFIPRSELFIDYEDPVGSNNFYAYEYQYWEKIIVCASCPGGRLVQGECVPDPSVIPRRDYYCESGDCFRMTSGTEIIFGNDEFSNGQSVSGFPIGGITFFDYGALLVEGSVTSVTRQEYNYGKVVQDLTSGNSGLNASTPAALNGNVRNVDPAGRTVLGFFGAGARSSTRTFVERSETTGIPLTSNRIIYNDPVIRAPCEGGGKTPVRPEGWGM